MTQDRASGAAGREYGLMMARGLAKLLGAKRLSQVSNEVLWDGKRAVIKSCAPATDQIGITVSMLPRLEVVLAAFENDQGQVDVWELDAEKFRAAMYDSRTRSGSGLQMLRRRYAEKEGSRVTSFALEAVKAAAR